MSSIDVIPGRLPDFFRHFARFTVHIFMIKSLKHQSLHNSIILVDNLSHFQELLYQFFRAWNKICNHVPAHLNHCSNNEQTKYLNHFEFWLLVCYLKMVDLYAPTVRTRNKKLYLYKNKNYVTKYSKSLEKFRKLYSGLFFLWAVKIIHFNSSNSKFSK